VHGFKYGDNQSIINEVKKMSYYKFNKTCSICLLNFIYDKKSGETRNMCKECIKKLVILN